MKTRPGIFPALLAGVSVLLLVIALSVPRLPGDTVQSARKVERIVGKRLQKLDAHVARGSRSIPADMVIYRYRGDTLVSWVNQFPVRSDDISSAHRFQRLSNPRIRGFAPLSQVEEQTGFYNFGPKWYLCRMENRGDTKILTGLEIMDSQDKSSFNGINPRLRLGDRYTIKPLTFSGGSAVSAGGQPQFKILYDSLTGTATADGTLMWCALALFVAAALIFLLEKKSLRRALAVCGGIVVAMAVMGLWGYSARTEYRIFSPTLYAGTFFHSLGSIIIVNIAILLVSLSLYLVRDKISGALGTSRARVPAKSAGAALIIFVAAYSFLSLRSICLNSSVCLELNKFSELSIFSFFVLISYVLMLLSIPMILKTLGMRPDLFSARGKLVYAFAVSAFIVLTTGLLGFRKEQNRLEVWADRLSLDRDISLELHLRRIEQQISGDVFIPALCQLDNAARTIQNRITDTYFIRESQNYDISVYLIFDDSLPSEIDFCNERLLGGEAISENSRFAYVYSPTGLSRYDGVFLYYAENVGVVRMLLEVVPKSGGSYQGYAELFGITGPGTVNIPSRYSYARYSGPEIQIYKGEYAYPTSLDASQAAQLYASTPSFPTSDSYRHFVNIVSAEEAVVISRPRFNAFSYAVAMVFIGLVIYLMLSVFSLRRRERGSEERSYYKSRISAVIMVSLVLALVAMAVVSVIFVTRSNEDNMSRVMSEKISAVQSMVQSRLGVLHSSDDLRSPEVMALLKGVSEDVRADVTIYTPDGRLVLSSTPEIFERMLLGARIHEKAYDSIIKGHKRYYINREKAGKRIYYSMYAPLLAEDGSVVAIVGSPYTSDLYNFERDAVLHAMAIFTVFVILMILAVVMTEAVIGKMFAPLSEMRKKMSSANLDSLEYINYDQQDEIQSLVQSYNRMVTELSESTRKLAQAERDKAWSGMARQVAHEIKNPLTPMKLQLQRIIRLKQRNDPQWQDKFDEVTQVLLDHIDILSETANEFSSFAKLYTEEPTLLNLDTVLQEEIAMFDNREDIHFDYVGLQNSLVSGPKPQLTRVFVNLINNAVQALEAQGGGRIFVALRHSVQDGYYDIVFEDDGPGVAEENVQKLFTPNFTTKNGGSGLGLAISRSVLERCGATISYSRSFTLGGACFTISYPK